MFASLALTGCVRPRNIHEPVPGAFEVVIPDSSRYLVEAAEYAITAEGIRIDMSDRKRALVESDFIDIGAVRATTDRSAYVGPERLVKFRFRARPTLGGSRLIGEAIYHLAGPSSGRAMERMVPEEHAGREVLIRMMARIEKRAREERVAREEKQRQPPAS